MGHNGGVAPLRDEELVRAYLRDRSEEAFRALYRAHSGFLFHLALRLFGGRHEEAEEALQETWIRAASRLDGFRGESSLRTWLRGVLVNCCRERWRRRRPEEVGIDGADRPASPAPAGLRLDLERLLRELPDGQREVLVLSQLEGYTHEEIAATLDIAPGTSKSRLFEARRTLRHRLDAGARPKPGDVA